MKHLDRIKFGEFVKRKRKAKRFRQSDLVDDVLTQPMLSSIENGKGNVSEQKVLYLLNKLGIEKSVLDQFTFIGERTKDEAIEELKLKLIAAESLFSLVGAEKGFERLRSIPVSNNHPYLVKVKYLKGEGCLLKKKWDKASDYFFSVLNLVQQYPEMKKSNLESTCFFELSRIEYFQSRFQKAIQYAETAYDLFQPDGERTHVKDLILISQCIYYEKLNQIGDAQKALDQLTQKMERPTQSKEIYFSETNEVCLNAYEMQAKLLSKSKRYPQAIEVALKGIERARVDKMYDRSFELWTTLGSIYIERDQLHIAECCFRTALELKSKIKSDSLLSYIHIQLGTLYDKQEEGDRSQREFHQALKHSQKINNVYHEVEALMGLGQCHLKRENTDQSIKLFKKALELANQHGFHEQKNSLFLLIGQCLMKTGDRPPMERIAMDFFYSNLTNIKPLEKGDEMMSNYQPKHQTTGEPPAP